MENIHSMEEKKEVVKIFAQEMADCQYDANTREEVIKSGIREHYRMR